MRKRLPLLLLAIILAAITGLIVSHFRCDCALRHGVESGDLRPWFHCEFGAGDTACAAIDAEQKQFAVECARHCKEIADWRTLLAELPDDAPAEERKFTEESLKAAEDYCQNERKAFAHRIASHLPEQHRARYLDLVLPRLDALDHHGAPDASGHR